MKLFVEIHTLQFKASCLAMQEALSTHFLNMCMLLNSFMDEATDQSVTEGLFNETASLHKESKKFAISRRQDIIRRLYYRH